MFPSFKDILITTMGTDYSQHECLSSSFQTFHRMAPSLQQFQHQLQLPPPGGANWGADRLLQAELMGSGNFTMQRHQFVTTAQICSYPEFVPIKVQCRLSSFLFALPVFS